MANGQANTNASKAKQTERLQDASRFFLVNQKGNILPSRLAVPIQADVDYKNIVRITTE